ncbi:MAG: NADH-quinone oxidoreductase subunit C [Alphaproteobacteria bacterium]|nr:NADH-quinone oxidoreductase subunit C [Alphaproteobacteria bacterium]
MSHDAAVAYIKQYKKIRVQVSVACDAVVLFLTQKDLLATAQLLSDDTLRVNILLDILSVCYSKEKTITYIAYSSVHAMRYRISFLWNGDPIPSLKKYFLNAGLLQKEVWEMDGVTFLDMYDKPVVRHLVPILSDKNSSVVWPHEHHSNLLLIHAETINGVIEKSFLQTGFLHRNIEKLLEEKTFLQYPFYMGRVDQHAGILQEYSWARVVEALLGMRVPKRCELARLVVSEIVRQMHHIRTIFTVAKEASFLILGRLYFSLAKIFSDVMFLVKENVNGYYIFPGGVKSDVSEHADLLHLWLKKSDEFIDFSEKWCVGTRTFYERTAHLGSLGEREAMSLGCTGPVLRATGSHYDVRVMHPYDAYAYIKPKVVTHSGGGAYARIMVMMEEVRESGRMVREALEMMRDTDPEYVSASGVCVFAKNDIWTKPVAMIRHSRLHKKGYEISGECYQSIEGPSGEKGIFLASDQAGVLRVKIRPSTLPHVVAWPLLSKGVALKDQNVLLASLGFSATEADR